MAFKGNLITGAMGYSLHKDFLSNSLQIRQTEIFNFELSSVDFVNLSAANIQNEVQSQFENVYSGDVHVTVFNTQNTFQYPSDSIRASRFNVTVEIKEPVFTLNTQFPELTNTFYYAGLDGTFWGNYGSYLLDFKESYSFSTNENGNRVFSHEVGFGLQTGWAGDNTQAGRKTFSQTIASSIFSQDDNLSFGLTTMIGQISGIANTSLYRNYYQESYDLYKNTYSFTRKREELPYDSGNSVFNLNYNINMGENGIIDVTEKASTVANINFPITQTNLNTFLNGSFLRCSGKYVQFYNDSIIAQDSQYGSLIIHLPLINTPVKTIKNYNSAELVANYEVSYTNNPEFSGDGTITSQTIEFNIGEYNQVEATNTFNYTVNRIFQGSGYLTGLMNSTTGNTQSNMLNYYSGQYPSIYNIYPKLNLIKYTSTIPNIKTKSDVKFVYSNNPTYFVTIQGVQYTILEYSVENKNPPDIITEYKIVNPPGHNSILSYQYQSEKGEINIKIKSVLGKNSSQFYPDGIGNFTDLNAVTVGTQPLIYFLQPLYMFGGQTFLAQFNYPIESLNWFLSDSKYTIDSDSVLTLNLSYVYTLKRRNYPQFQ